MQFCVKEVSDISETWLARSGLAQPSPMGLSSFFCILALAALFHAEAAIHQGASPFLPACSLFSHSVVSAGSTSRLASVTDLTVTFSEPGSPPVRLPGSHITQFPLRLNVEFTAADRKHAYSLQKSSDMDALFEGAGKAVASYEFIESRNRWITATFSIVGVAVSFSLSRHTV